MKKEFYLIDNSSFKFWSIELLDTSYITKYGKIGTKGTTKQKDFSNLEIAQKQLEKQIKSKLNKGYIEVNPSGESLAEKLHFFAQQYNWDNGFGALNKIINCPECDKGTALLIYWLSTPGYFCQYENRDLVPKHELTNYDFVRGLEKKYMSDFFQGSNILFNPQWDKTTIDSNGYNWTNEYQTEQKNLAIPKLMKQPSKRDLEWEQRKEE